MNKPRPQFIKRSTAAAAAAGLLLAFSANAAALAPATPTTPDSKLKGPVATPPPLQPLPPNTAPNITNNANYKPQQLPNPQTSTQQNSDVNSFPGLSSGPSSPVNPLGPVRPYTPQNQTSAIFIIFVIIVLFGAIGYVWYNGKKKE